MQKKLDLYSELGLTPEAEPEVIRAAYRALAQRYHPDRHHGSVHLASIKEKMARINHAYNILSQPERRRAYDASLVTPSVRLAAPTIHALPSRPHKDRPQPFLTTYDQRGRLHSFV